MTNYRFTVVGKRRDGSDYRFTHDNFKDANSFYALVYGSIWRIPYGDESKAVCVRRFTTLPSDTCGANWTHEEYIDG